MVMYTTTYGIDEMIDCSSVTNIEYSYKISKLEQKLYKKLKIVEQYVLI